MKTRDLEKELAKYLGCTRAEAKGFLDIFKAEVVSNAKTGCIPKETLPTLSNLSQEDPFQEIKRLSERIGKLSVTLTGHTHDASGNAVTDIRFI